MLKTKLPEDLEKISRHMKIVRFSSILPLKTDPWRKIIGMFKFGKKVNIEHLLEEKGFENDKQYI